MDALSNVLRAANLTGGVFLRAEFTAPWCVAMQVTGELCAPFLGRTAHLIPYHYVVEGSPYLALSDGAPQRLKSGEMVLFPRNDSHVMGSDLDLPPVASRDVI